MDTENVDTINAEINKAELELKQLDILLKKDQLKKNDKKSILSIETATIIVAVIAFLGSSIGTFLQGYFAQQQQRKEFESTLIINAIETGSSDVSKKNLKFLLDAGLISEGEKQIKIASIVADTTYHIYSRISMETVYICNNINAYAYHKKDCDALLRCNDTIVAISLFDAYSRKCSPCKICY